MTPAFDAIFRQRLLPEVFMPAQRDEFRFFHCVRLAYVV